MHTIIVIMKLSRGLSFHFLPLLLPFSLDVFGISFLYPSSIADWIWCVISMCSVILVKMIWLLRGQFWCKFLGVGIITKILSICGVWLSLGKKMFLMFELVPLPFILYVPLICWRQVKPLFLPPCIEKVTSYTN